jgi:predicted nucleic acid-binding protein
MVIAYFTTPAVLALVVDDAASAVAQEMWTQSDRVVTIVMAEVEACATIADASRQRIVTPRQASGCVRVLRELLAQIDLVAVDTELVRTAAELAGKHRLRSGQAVQLASAHQVMEDDVVFVDRGEHLLAAASRCGLLIAPLVQR